MKQRLLLILLLIPFCNFAAIYYVKPAATGAGDGLSWANATTLQNAIDLAAVSGVTDEIWIMQGTYIPTSGTGRNKSFFLSNGTIKLYGGFNGTETLVTQRNPKLNVTVLSGDINGDDNTSIIATEATRQDNAYHVITVKNSVVALTNVTIDGCTISGGNANGPTLTTGAAASQYYHTRGGAIYIHTVFTNDEISVQTTDCIVEKNSASDSAVSSGYFSGGISNQTFRTNFDRCIIRNNHSGINSAILVGGANGFFNFGSASILSCLFHNNTSTSGASCLFASASLANGGNGMGISVQVKNSTFTANNGVNTLKLNEPSQVSFYNNIIYGNTASTAISITQTTGWPLFQDNILEGSFIPATNSTANPLLKPDYTLNSTSPAIDSGSVTWVSGMTLDLSGNPRIYNAFVDKGCYEYNPTLSSTDFNSFSNFSIYPNPTNGDLHIQSDEEIVKVVLFSLDGKPLLETENTFLQISELPSGVYIVSLENSIGEKGTKKIIKR